MTCAVIVQQFIEGYQKGGWTDSIARGVVAAVKSAVSEAIFIVLIESSPILFSAGVVVFASLAMDFVCEILFNHFKM